MAPRARGRRPVRHEQLDGRAGRLRRAAGRHGHPTTAATRSSLPRSATVEHLRRHAPDVRRVLAIGADGMREELLERRLRGDDGRASLGRPATRRGRWTGAFDAVIVGLDPTSTTAAWRSRCARSPTARASSPRMPMRAIRRRPGFLPGAGRDRGGARRRRPARRPTSSASRRRRCSAPSSRRAAMRGGGGGRGRRQPGLRTSSARDRAGCAAILVLTGVADAAWRRDSTAKRRPDAVAADPAAVRTLLEPASADGGVGAPRVPRPRRRPRVSGASERRRGERAAECVQRDGRPARRRARPSASARPRQLLGERTCR